MAALPAQQAIAETLALPDEDQQAALEAIQKRFDVVSTIRAFESAGYTTEFEIKQYMRIARSRKATPETRRRALDALQSIRERVSYEPQKPSGESTPKNQSQAEKRRLEAHGRDWQNQADTFG